MKFTLRSLRKVFAVIQRFIPAARAITAMTPPKVDDVVVHVVDLVTREPVEPVEEPDVPEEKEVQYQEAQPSEVHGRPE